MTAPIRGAVAAFVVALCACAAPATTWALPALDAAAHPQSLASVAGCPPGTPPADCSPADTRSPPHNPGNRGDKNPPHTGSPPHNPGNGGNNTPPHDPVTNPPDTPGNGGNNTPPHDPVTNPPD